MHQEDFLIPMKAKTWMIEAMERLFKLLCPVLAALLLCSCGKETFREIPVCTHAELVHHPAVEAGRDTRGNIEYWSCPCCGKRYRDAQGKEEYSGRIYILPTKFIDSSCLAGYRPFAEQTKDGITAATVATIAEMLVTISGLAVTCVSYCDDCEYLIEEIGKVTYNENQDAINMAYMDECLSRISSNVKAYNQEMDRMQVKVDEMIREIDEANAILQDTRETLVKSLNDVAKVEQNMRIYNLFDTRYRDVVNLDVSTSHAWTAVSDLLHKGEDLLAGAGTARDSADVLINKTHQIESIVSAWGTDKSYPDKTASLLTRYLHMDADYGSSFVNLLDDYSADYFVWEHQAISFKKMILDYDFTVVSQAFALTTIYYSLLSSGDNNYRNSRIESMRKDFDAMVQLASDKTLEYEDAFLNRDRVCNVTGKIFSIDAKDIYPESFWLLYGLSSDYEETLQKAIDDYDAELLCVGSNSSSLWDICFTDMGFHTGADAGLPAALIVPLSEDNHRIVVSDAYDSSVTVDIWAYCRVDNMVRQEIYLGAYTGNNSDVEVSSPPAQYSYFTLEVTGRKEDVQ